MSKPLSINITHGHNTNSSNSLSVDIYWVACSLDRLVTFPTLFPSATEPSSHTFCVKCRMNVAFVLLKSHSRMQNVANRYQYTPKYASCYFSEATNLRKSIAKSLSRTQNRGQSGKPIIGPYGWIANKSAHKEIHEYIRQGAGRGDATLLSLKQYVNNSPDLTQNLHNLHIRAKSS